MRLLILTLLITVATCEQIWNPLRFMSRGSENFQNFFGNQSDKMKSFLEAQKGKVENVFKTGYESAKQVTESVNQYWEDRQKQISDDINNYVDSVQENGRKVMDSWSYLPIEEEGARIDDPELVLSVPAIITANGYPCETHTIISDGYILNVHRIPRGKNHNKTPSKTVLLQHGLLASSADWILNGPEKSLGYFLAEAGYDVWMTNIRGNKYSREHAWLKTNSKSYWNFSWHDVAKHDVPAVINYILNLKKNASLTYIGHSMGTTILFAMLTLRPEYNDILTSAVALAPVVFTSDIKSPLRSLASVASNVAYMEMLYGSYEFVPKNSALGKMASACDSNNADSKVCKNAIFYICGYDDAQLDQDRLNVFVAHLGTGTSWKTVVHFAQETNSGGKFQQFDYGFYQNLKVYGQTLPPQYDLSKVTLPISLFWAENDLLSSEKDVRKLFESLPSNSTELYLVPYPEFNHVDYLIARDAPKLVNEKLLETLSEHDSPVYVTS